MTTFYLVRHAHAEWTPDENRILSAQGQKDSILVADVLNNLPIRSIYSSPARRARQTIAPLASRLSHSICIEPDLRERKLGNAVFENFFEAVEITWINPAINHPGGESSLTARARGIAVVQVLMEKHPYDHIVLSTHGNLMALILQGFDPKIDFAFWKSLTMPDVYQLTTSQTGHGLIRRLWQDVTNA